jgi:hypothetical protein
MPKHIVSQPAPLHTVDMFTDDLQQDPLPVRTAHKYDFPLQRYTLDNDDLVYSAHDWIAGLTGETSPKKITQMWEVFKKQYAISNRILKMPYVSSDGKTYQRDFVSNKDLFAFAAYARPVKSRPQIKTVKDFLAKAGAFTDDLQQDLEGAQQTIQSARVQQAIDAGRSDEWIATRELAVITRKQFTEAIHKANPDMHIGDATNRVYDGVLGTNAAGLRKRLGLGEKQNPRDYMSEMALIYNMAAEAGIRSQLSEYGDDDVLPLPVVQETIRVIALATGMQARDMANLLNIDLITGQKRLPK